MTLYRHAQKREEQRMRFQAHLHGLSVKDEASEQAQQTVEAPQEDFTFGEPSSYDHLSKDEKQKLTKKLPAIFGLLGNINYLAICKKK